jgi:hypothetical protein
LYYIYGGGGGDKGDRRQKYQGFVGSQLAFPIKENKTFSFLKKCLFFPSPRKKNFVPFSERKTDTTFFKRIYFLTLYFVALSAYRSTFFSFFLVMPVGQFTKNF